MQSLPRHAKRIRKDLVQQADANSIGTIKELSTQFTSHFIEGHKYKKSTACLISIKQQEDETLRSYIARFNKHNGMTIIFHMDLALPIFD